MTMLFDFGMFLGLFGFRRALLPRCDGFGSVSSV